MGSTRLNFWFKTGLFNLVLVALLGLLMRYKIAFDFPFFQQRFLLHAHSHFAFNGWVTHLLFCGLASVISPFLSAKRMKSYELLIALNVLCSFGILISFALSGYKPLSIALSTGGIIIAIAYTWLFMADRKKFPAGHPSIPWASMGLWLGVLSSAGPLALGYMMSTKTITSDLYLGSVYYYLHFQYSGWFFFGSAALILNRVKVPDSDKFFRIFAITVIPTFFLSVLWVKIPLWLYILTVIATVVQLLAWLMLIRKSMPLIRQMRYSVSYPNWINLFFYAAIISLTLKFILQTISVIPSLSQLVFGIRPIVIAYLHLVLLGVYSLFLIGYLLATRGIRVTALARVMSITFLVGVVLNESFLAVQGIGAFSYQPIPLIGELLALAAAVLFLSALGFWLAQLGGKRDPQGAAVLSETTTE